MFFNLVQCEVLSCGEELGNMTVPKLKAFADKTLKIDLEWLENIVERG